MRASEKNFLKHVTSDYKLLNEIAEKADLSYSDAYDMATYLEKQGMVRTTWWYFEGKQLHVVCKPIDKRSWKEKYWWVISLSSFLGGIAAKIVAELNGK
jgi:hypothetical protein